MKINIVAIGNEKEAYIEDRFTSNVNIIYSNDNHKGKTILMQSISYALGITEVFPEDFIINNYYVFLDCSINGKKVKIVRRRKNILLILDDKLYMYDNISEFKHFYNRNIKKLPQYIKDEREKVVDFPVYYELSIIPQDRRNASNLINRDNNSKNDFLQMIASMGECEYTSNINTEELDKLIKEKQQNLKILRKKIKIANQDKSVFSGLSGVFDREEYNKIQNRIKEIDKDTSLLNRKRTLESNRIIKLENLITELNSLNTKIDEGHFICKECGSEKIIFKKGDIVFDTSNSDVRNNILDSIKKQTNIKKEIILECDIAIEKNCNLRRTELTSIPNEANNYFLYLDEIKNLDSNLLSLDTITKEIKELKEQKREKKTNDENMQKEYKILIKNIINKMNEFQNNIDNNTKTKYKDIFTTITKIYSGSRETEYYFCRTMALLSVLEHDLPIIIDAFREKGLSSSKENKMIDIFKSLNRQVIVTATLKDEEYTGKSKYGELENVNALDFDEVENSKLLNAAYCSKFKLLLKDFGIKI